MLRKFFWQNLKACLICVRVKKGHDPFQLAVSSVVVVMVEQVKERGGQF